MKLQAASSRFSSFDRRLSLLLHAAIPPRLDSRMSLAPRLLALGVLAAPAVLANPQNTAIAVRYSKLIVFLRRPRAHARALSCSLETPGLTRSPTGALQT